MDFLLEIHTEEMPPSHVKAGLSQLEEKIREELVSQNVEVGKVETLGTCRRLVVEGDFAAGQRDREEEVLGPPRAVAFNPDGSPSPAATGFASAQRVDYKELAVIKTERGEYLGIRKVIKGRPTREILTEILPSLISSLSFPKMMRWRTNGFRFSRPIKNILCLFEEKPLSFSVAGVESGNSTIGHKIHSPRKIRVKNLSEYREMLGEAGVIVDPQERRKMILKQMEQKLGPLKAAWHPDEDLLEGLVYDVEHPLVFLGAFPQEYLSLPLEVLSTAMREGQKLFSVVRDKKQLPLFIGVADSPQDPRELIKKGNERVLRARLEDARFFWKQDRKTELKERVKDLKDIMFQEKLGSYEEKAQRVKKIASYMADKLDAKKVKKNVLQAAELAKVDLLTEMVREFPSLQGKMGGLYSREEGYPALVWRAIYEHYQPVSLDDESPSSQAGAILSIADKIDSIVGVVGIGIRVTGSSDPFGLRRNAQGVCKTIIEKKLSFSFPRLLDKVLTIFGTTLQNPREEVRNSCLDFFTGRLRYIFERQGFRYDLVNAALGAGIDNIYYSYLRVRALDALKDSPNFEPLILIAKRVNNILRGQPACKVNTDLLAEKEERELFTTFSIVKDNVIPLIKKGDFSQVQKIIFRIRSTINKFFDNVLVMAEEKKLRENRLALLQAVSKLLNQVADYSQVVIEGENREKG